MYRILIALLFGVFMPHMSFALSVYQLDDQFQDCKGSAATNIAQTQCLHQAVKEWTDYINTTFSELQKILPPARAKELSDSQSAWLDFHEKSKTAITHIYNKTSFKGNQWEEKAQESILGMMRQRAVELESLFKDYEKENSMREKLARNVIEDFLNRGSRSVGIPAQGKLDKFFSPSLLVFMNKVRTQVETKRIRNPEVEQILLDSHLFTSIYETPFSYKVLSIQSDFPFHKIKVRFHIRRPKIECIDTYILKKNKIDDIQYACDEKGTLRSFMKNNM
ncbi:lysozyme inhibitor LprI family protein [Algicola sagamiensis]|uniref:lysozyme inhibitor LprI family protein n=1 Tax=Algicola sagamiensis TaxID=163869 RepID=UPI00036C8037|nr:lysozyme inhibitor LprI family protein [Algicola sagamiensis]